MRLLACLAVGVLTVQGPSVRAAPGELAPGFKVGAWASGKSGPFHLHSWRLQRRDAGSSPIELVLVTAEDRHVKARIQPVLKRGSAGSLLYTPSLCPRALVVTNGSFYIRDGDKSAPLGLVRSGGRTLAKLSRRRSGGFLVINGGRIGLLPRAAVGRALASTDAIESTPIVVRDGANDMHSDDGVRFDRVGVGTASNGRTVVIGAFGQNQDSISLYEFSTLARAAVAATGGRLRDLLALDGGPSAHIYLPGARRIYGYRGPSYLPNAICIGPR